MKYAILTDGVVSNIALAETAMESNWILIDGLDPQPNYGWTYANGVFTAPEVVEPLPVVDPAAKLIDLGPFFDRFGALKMAVLTSQDVGVKAILQDLTVRKWVDLTRPDVSSALQYVGSKVTQLTPAAQELILNAPVTDEENRVLKRLYF